MRLNDWAGQKFIYIIVLGLLAMVVYTIYAMETGDIGQETAKVFIQALTAIATLALLYYAFWNTESRKEEDVAHLELAVRPVLLWELKNKGSGAVLVYRTIKRPIYDFRATLKLNEMEMDIEELHLEVADNKGREERQRDITEFIKQGLSGRGEGKIEITFSYHSEVGGKYVFSFSKEVVAKPGSFVFQHRKILSAKYPWKAKPVVFTD